MFSFTVKFKAATSKFKPKKKEPIKECDESESPCCVTCRYVKSETCGSENKKLRCQKEPPLVIPSYSALSKSVSSNSKYCCCAFSLFLKEVGRAIRGDSNARISETLSELTEVMLAIANDCLLFMGRIGCTTVDTVKIKSRVYALLIHNKLCAFVARSRKKAAEVAEKMKAELIKVIQENVLEPKMPEFGGEGDAARKPKRSKRKKPIPKRKKKKKQPKNWTAKNYRL
ncbi:jg3049 [Pararge aegeria aegeria]|uniref:Jg3049 protein n=1 Tax=Pararge aegeria aegeria TaxID=348720 RepID=A0A8S4RVD3_9NEOP|nr:jg3049 [Pararge aegeria aegeria]